MLGSFLTRGLVLVFGYAYPAYECYKTVERNKPEIEHLRFWCQYWILVAVLTVCERVGDAFISWVPMYSEAKLAFFIYLWYPKTKGTTYVYDSFFRPYMAKHENEIDRNLLELRTRAGDVAVLYWQRAASYGQTRVFDILQYIAAQSTPRARPAQPQQPGPRTRQATTHQPPVHVQPENEEPEPPSPTSSTTSSHDQREVPDVAGPSHAPKTVASPSNAPKTVAPAPAPTAAKTNSTSETSSQLVPTEAEGKQLEAVPSTSNENTNPPPKETVMDETLRRTRGKLRKARVRKDTDSAAS